MNFSLHYYRTFAVFLSKRLRVTKSGEVLGCGRKHGGQLGLEDRADVFAPTKCFPSLNGIAVVAVAGGDAHSLCVLDDGSLVAFGRPAGCGSNGDDVVDAVAVPLPHECFHVVAAGYASLALCRAGALARRASATRARVRTGTSASTSGTPSKRPDPW